MQEALATLFYEGADLVCHDNPLERQLGLAMLALAREFDAGLGMVRPSAFRGWEEAAHALREREG
ncbi:MAG: hypothetical protein NTW56_08510 [Alphaproteobacteria bacterium]|jgi:hypothetical protein|nr:hypothetical protein [Alphaproteobacteria bacterium]